MCAFSFFFSSRRRHTRCSRDWSSDVCSSDLALAQVRGPRLDVYGRFRLDYATQLRRDAIRHLTESADLRYVGGGGVVRYSRFLREVADAKICINLPGDGDLCFRLIDYLAVGACVICPRLRTRLHVPLVDREHIVYTADDLSDLVPL